MRIALSLALLVLVGLLAPSVALLLWATRPGPSGSGTLVERFSDGQSPTELSQRLFEIGLIESPGAFSLYLRFLSPSVSVVPGPHLLRRGDSPRALLRRLGRLPSRPRLRVNLPEGYTYLKVAERLEKNEICAARVLQAKARDPVFLAELGIAGESAEGYLFPATYELFVDSDAAAVIRQMVQETKKRLVRLDAAAGGPLSKLQEARDWSERDVLTMASMVEREASAPDELLLVASVFFNRLDDPSFRPPKTLQSDPTAAYGCLIAPGEAPSCAGFRGRVTPAILRDPKNRYNTYRHPGLPPGPIANPGEAAIRAVLGPARTEYLYFVADGRGRHRFSRTYAEHQQAIATEAD